jgi:hypothetical protein
MTGAVLQKKMRHRSFQTTLRYISLSDKMKKATENVYVPEFLQGRKADWPTEQRRQPKKRRNPLKFKGLRE